MGGDEDTMKVGIFSYPLHLCNTTYISWVWPNNPNGILLNEFLEIIPQVNLLTGMDRSRGAVCYFTVHIS